MKAVMVEGLVERVRSQCHEKSLGVAQALLRFVPNGGGGGFKLLGVKSSKEFKGDDSLDDMSMMLVLASFLGGFLVDEEAIDAIFSGTDMLNITRKPSKTGKHGHEKRKSTREAKDSKPKPEKTKPQSKKVKP
ncbi:hypothetical protein Tco_1037924 [Tanacetum coccineum]